MLGLKGVQGGKVASGWGRSSATTALANDHAGGTSLHVVVGNIAVIRSLVPERISLDALAAGLAGNLDVLVKLVGLDHLVAGSWTGAAVDGSSCDGIGGSQGGADGQGNRKESEMHGDNNDEENEDEDEGKCLAS